MADQTKNFSDLKQEILELWGNPKFSGAFTGLHNLQKALFLEKNIKVDLKTLRDIMRHNPTYIQHIISKQKFPRRTYEGVHGYGEIFR